MAQPSASRPAGSRRIVAGFVDLAILGGGFVGMAAGMGELQAEGAQFAVRLSGGPALLFFAGVIAYYQLSESWLGASPGKLLLGLRVVSATPAPLTFGRLLVRNLMRVIDGLPVCYLVGVIAMACTERSQRLGDLAAGTLVVRDSGPPIASG